MTATPPQRKAAAFFDVDGTLAATTIVHYYAYFRRRTMSVAWRPIWSAAFLLKCVYFLLLDRKDRSRFNVAFYRSYAGMSVSAVRDHADDCHRDVIAPRHFPEGFACAAEHREAGREVVLVTGSIDFLLAPLAEELHAVAVLSPGLVERDGRFTGALTGPPVGDAEKARRVRAYSDQHNIDLAQSHAYGDSIADLPMLETVGHPHAVNPDKALSRIAQARDWPVHRWAVVGDQAKR